MVVALPLFKLGALFVRHISKYGANFIKRQAHEHLRVRALAARYGQVIHQINMRMNVALLRNPEAEKRAREKLEAPTVKTKEQVEKEEQLKIKYGTTAKDSHPTRPPPKSIWKRKFRPLPEEKAVDLFSDVVGDAFILGIASGLIIFEYYRSSQKPDHNAEKIKEMDKMLEKLKRREEELEELEKQARSRVNTIEKALRAFQDSKANQPLLPAPATSP